MKIKVIKLLGLFVLGAALIASTSWATPILVLSDGTDSVLVTDQDFLGDGTPSNPGDGSPTAGVVVYNGAVGTNWTVNVTTGISGLSSPTPNMDLNSVNFTSTGAGSLYVVLTDDPVWSSGVGGLDVQVGGTTNGTVDFDVLIDSVVMSELGPFGPGAFSGSDSFVGTGTTVQIAGVITHTAAGQLTSFDLQLQPIPEPATMLLLGTGLVGVAGAARRRKKNQA